MIIMPKDDTITGKNTKSQSNCMILSPEDITNGKTTEIDGLEITGVVRNLSPYLWTPTFCNITRLVVRGNQLTRVPSEITNLRCLIHLDLSNNMLRSLPPEIGDLVTLRELLLKHNYLRVLPNDLGKLFQLQVLNLDDNPMSPEICQLYSDPKLSVASILNFMLNKLQIPSVSAPLRQWRKLNEVDENATSYIFTIMSYNVLAENYASRQTYGYCPQWALAWQHRKKQILNEILSQTADIVCLQEVVTDEFHQFFLPELTKDGYGGMFSPKSRAKTMTAEERKHVDGCAIFFKSSKFNFVKEQLVEFTELAREKVEFVKQNGSKKPWDDFINRVMTKDNIGVVSVLEFKGDPLHQNPGDASSGSGGPHRLVIANVHIHWDPEYCDVKLMQVLLFMAELRKISKDMPIVISGDFNSLPSSGVIKFLRESRIPFCHEDFKDIDYKHFLEEMAVGAGQDADHSVTVHSTEITHPYCLSSAYENLRGYTNYTYDFKGVIDYIFYPSDTMKPLGVLELVGDAWFKEHKIIGCPHPAIPSDHFLLITELQMFTQKTPATTVTDSDPKLQPPPSTPSENNNGSTNNNPRR